jgi:hypothetical protein
MHPAAVNEHKKQLMRELRQKKVLSNKEVKNIMVENVKKKTVEKTTEKPVENPATKPVNPVVEKTVEKTTEEK